MSDTRTDSIATPRPVLIAKAFLLEWITLAWMSVEAAVALWSGLAARSLTLVAFGFESVIELASAGVLIWRLTVEIKHGQEFSEFAERRAGQIAGALLFALAVYVVASAAWGLWQHRSAEFSLSGLTVAVIAIPTMVVLSRSKIRVAEQLGSRALRADAIEAITCGYLSAVVVVGLIAQVLFHLWWLDSVTSLAITYFLVEEGREAWIGDDCCG